MVPNFLGEDQLPPISTIINEPFLERYFNLSHGAKNEVAILNLIDFNIFNMQKETLDNELVTVTSLILAKADIFS